MPSQILAPGKTVANSADQTVAAGAILNIGLYLADDDNLLLPDGSPYWEGDFLLPDGASVLLFDTQATGGAVPWGDEVHLFRKDPLGAYNETGIILNQRRPDYAVVGPVVIQVRRLSVTNASIGVQKD